MYIILAQEAQRFKEELVPVPIKSKKSAELTVDEHPRPQTTFEGLQALKSIFKENGLVTAGTASVICLNYFQCMYFESLTFQGICDGAGAVLIASEEAVTRNNLKPLARVAAFSTVGVDPSIMGIGPVPAIQNVLKLSGKTLDDIDLVEVSSICIQNNQN